MCFKIHVYVLILLSQIISPTTGQLTGLVLLGILAVFSKTSPRRNHPVRGPSRLAQNEDYKESQCAIAQFHLNIQNQNRLLVNRPAWSS